MFSSLGLTGGLTILFMFSCLAGSVIQSVSGFGFAIFMMSVIPNFLPSSVSTAVSGLLSLSTNTANTVRYRSFINWKQILFPIIGYSIASLIVVSFFAGKSEDILKRILGAVLIALSIYFFFFSSKIHIHPTARNGFLAGTLSGILGELFSMSGPPIVIYMLSTGTEKESYMGTIQCYFFLTNLYTTILRMTKGLITLQVIELSLLGITFSFIGFWIGTKILSCINAEVMKKIIYTFLAVSGLNMLLP